MLYSLQIPQKEKPTQTYIFGTKMLLTLGVEIIGKNLDPLLFTPFYSIDELIGFKNAMRNPYSKDHIPIKIYKDSKGIQISGRLYKAGGLKHDPNIGALSMIATSLRFLGWEKSITIIQHGLSQEHCGTSNKFIQIANSLKIKLQNINLPTANFPTTYWHYERTGEKLGTMFIHITVENFTESYSIFDNHAGCEKSYFTTSTGQKIPLAKYYDRDKYKSGDKSQKVFIPDLVLLDIKNSEAITVEGKKYKNRKQGIAELQNYTSFDDLYLKKYYPQYSIIRTVVLYGGSSEEIIEVEVGFLLNEKGKIVLGIKAPRLFLRGVENLLDYWN